MTQVEYEKEMGQGCSGAGICMGWSFIVMEINGNLEKIEGSFSRDFNRLKCYFICNL